MAEGGGEVAEGHCLVWLRAGRRTEWARAVSCLFERLFVSGTENLVVDERSNRYRTQNAILGTVDTSFDFLNCLLDHAPTP